MIRNTRVASWLPAAALAVLAGCGSVGPDYVAPDARVPEAWIEEPASGLSSGPAELASWWRRLGDPVLDALVDRALRNGPDLREAVARVREARALRGSAAAGRFPAVEARAAYERSQESESTTFGSLGGIRASDLFEGGFDATWEIDLFGRVARDVEAADAFVAASVEDARDVLVTLAAETALNYVEVRAFQRRLRIARTNVELQEQTLALVRARLESGLVTERDVAQAAANLETTRARLPELETLLRAAENRVAVLAGLPPGAPAADLAAERPVPVPPVAVAVGVPADLLRRRADVRRAERALAAETARIGVAEADLYPRLTLFGSLGLASDDVADLFSGPAGVFRFGPSLRWNLFDAGKVRSRVEAQDARREQALVRWERAVLLALEEAENAMTAFVREQVRRRSLAEAVTQAHRSVDLAQTQYREGLTDFQVVLDSERARAGLEDDLAGSEAAIATDLVRLYKALGGGWEDAGPFPLAEEGAAGTAP